METPSGMTSQSSHFGLFLVEYKVFVFKGCLSEFHLLSANFLMYEPVQQEHGTNKWLA